MTIKSKLLLSTMLQIILVVLMSVFLILTTRQINRSTNTEEHATQIVKTVTEIRFVSFENILRQDERSFEQWQTKHKHLGALLAEQSANTAEERQILATIARDSAEIETLFNRLRASYDEPQNTPYATTIKDFQERLANQILLKQQRQITDALQLSAIAGDHAALLRQRADQLVGLVIILMLSITAFNFFFVTNTLGKALRLLQEGADKIAGGDFAHRITPYRSTDEFGRLTTAFNSMATSLEQTDKVKSDFILLASHQLRTPLTAVKWSVEELLAPKMSLAPAKQRQYLQKIHQSNERMIELANSLLEVSKIDFGTLPSKPVLTDPKTAVGQAIKELDLELLHREITINRTFDHTLPAILIDPGWLQIILHNLLINAIRYSAVGQHIAVRLEQQADGVLIKIADSGIGIPADQHSKIFSKFFRAKNAQKADSSGSGLGLYTVKALVERVGGTIWFKSAEREGTTFYVKLPLPNEKPVKKE